MRLSFTSYAMKRKFNSDGHQFHQYQQNEQLPLILAEFKKATTRDVGNPGPGMGQTQTCVFYLSFTTLKLLPFLDRINKILNELQANLH